MMKAFNIVTMHTLSRYRSIEICVVKPGQPGKKIEVSSNCTIRELRRKVKERMEVEPERQTLLYNGQVLVDEQPEAKEETIVTDIVEFKGNEISPNPISGTPIKFCQYVLIYNNSFCKRNVLMAEIHMI